MQKNSITNKITPCCGLPFSVVYWWVSNLTLNSESDREYLLTQISQNGVLSIDGWKVLINSGTLEADASLTKAEFLAWFECGKQPTCEQLKLIIEGFKVGNWTPETQTELPLNLATVDKILNGSTYVGNVYTKQTVDDKINDLKDYVKIGINGNAKQSNAPTVYSAENFPNGLFERYIVSEPLTSPNSWGNIEVSQSELNENFVYFNVKNGVVEKELSAKPISNNYDKIIWIEGYFLVDNGTLSPAPWMDTIDFLRIKPNRYYNLNRTVNINYKSVYFFDKDKNFISKVETQIFKTPANAEFLRFSKEESETFDFHLISENEIIVSQTVDFFDFDDMTKAVNFANSTGEICRIKIIGKINLTETLNVMQPHIFIGETPKTSILEFVSNYELLKTTVASYSNITFSRVAVLGGYCIHPDYAGEGVVEFDNCVIFNKMGTCIGSGSHANQTLRLKNCELKSINGSETLLPTLYWHNNVNDLPNQRLELINTTVYSDYERPLQISDQNLNLGNGLNRDSEILAVNCQFYGALYGKGNMLISQPAPIGTKTVAGNIKLNPLSGGNNIDVLNY